MAFINLAIATAVHWLFQSEGFFTPFLGGITMLGDYGFPIVLSAIVLICFNRSRPIGACALMATIFGFVITNLLLKNILAVDRPFLDEESIYYQYWLETGSLMTTEYSFPSGHTTSATCFSITIFISSKNKKNIWPILFFPFLVCLSRIYFSVHYFSDVLGGLLVGLCSGLASFFLVHFLSRKKNFEKMMLGFRK